MGTMVDERLAELLRRAADAAAAGDSSTSISIYREALDLQPDSAPLVYNLGLELAAAGRIGEARTLFRRAAGLNPEDSDALSDLGRLEIKEGRLGAATEALDEALNRNSRHPGSLNNRGVTAFLKGDYPLAAEYFRKAVSEAPELSEGWYNLADALDESGETEKATEARRRCRDLETGNV